MLSNELYIQLINKFEINKWNFFITYDELKNNWKKEKSKTAGVKLDSEKYSKTLSNILKVPKENIYVHPTQKPIALMEKLITVFSNENDVVLDCFMGSGSTGVAALKNNRKFIDCELSKEYFEISKKRIFG